MTPAPDSIVSKFTHSAYSAPRKLQNEAQGWKDGLTSHLAVEYERPISANFKLCRYSKNCIKALTVSRTRLDEGRVPKSRPQYYYRHSMVGPNMSSYILTPEERCSRLGGSSARFASGRDCLAHYRYMSILEQLHLPTYTSILMCFSLLATSDLVLTSVFYLGF